MKYESSNIILIFRNSSRHPGSIFLFCKSICTMFLLLTVGVVHIVILSQKIKILGSLIRLSVGIHFEFSSLCSGHDLYHTSFPFLILGTDEQLVYLSGNPELFC